MLGFDNRTHNMLCSNRIEFLDRENAVVLDSNGIAWLLLEGAHLRVDSHTDLTEDYAALFKQHRNKPNTPPLTSEQKQLLRKLLSNRGTANEPV